MRENIKSEKAKERYDRNYNSIESSFTQKELEEHDRNIRNKAIDEFSERLKGKTEEILKNPDIVAECKKCTIWTVRDIDEIAEQLKGGAT